MDYLLTHGVSESQFRSDVKWAYAHSNGGLDVRKSLEVNVPSSNKVVYVEGTNINVRKGPGTNYSVIRQINKPESYAVLSEKMDG